MVVFPPFFKGRQLLCFPAQKGPSEKGSTLKRNNLLPLKWVNFKRKEFAPSPSEKGSTLVGANSFFLK